MLRALSGCSARSASSPSRRPSVRPAAPKSPDREFHLVPTPSHPVLDRVLFSTFGHPAPGTDDQPRDDHGRFAPAGGGTGPRPDLHPGAVVSVSQGDGFKITTPHGHIDYRHADGTNEIWWVESHKKGHGSDLVDAMQGEQGPRQVTAPVSLIRTASPPPSTCSTIAGSPDFRALVIAVARA